MIFKWETRTERLKKNMQIPALKRLEWLQKMYEFLLLSSSNKDTKKIRKQLRERR